MAPDKSESSEREKKGNIEANTRSKLSVYCQHKTTKTLSLFVSLAQHRCFSFIITQVYYKNMKGLQIFTRSSVLLHLLFSICLPPRPPIPTPQLWQLEMCSFFIKSEWVLQKISLFIRNLHIFPHKGKHNVSLFSLKTLVPWFQTHSIYRLFLKVLHHAKWITLWTNFSKLS